MIVNEYNKLAPYYDFLARMVFGKRLLRAKLHFLHLLPEHAKICIIGGGTGHVLQQLLKNNPHTQIIYLEKSSKMIALARQKLNQNMLTQVRFVEGDVSNLAEEEKYDVIITNFFLDQFSERRLTILMKSLNSRLQAGGLWLFTDFVLTKRSKNYWWQFPLVKFMFAFFKLTVNIESNKLLEFNLFFQALGLEINNEQYFLKKLLVTRIYKRKSSK
ncbi:class I SAM-dependent methyltransferase [Fulvivirgaceae bacterium BMA12]|uniref:Class I SAM-dependent methyltransferase n=1 Tax=Agaribacillus aureus TaxID=3051825 RepID=A0ABT8L4I8_9BACT|nr:class I SAM-dependent methyltransferase [Fulvivirgaceae bacterium BMA12]